MISLKQYRQVLINYCYHLPAAIFWSFYYRFPARHLKIIGVTGTDGKTTTTTFIWHILKKSGKKVGLINTIITKMGKNEIATGLHVTSPQPHQIQKFLFQMKKNNLEYAVLETTSHGLDQFRFWGIKFHLGLVTNVTPEHIDYHQTFKNYLQAKGKLIKQSAVVILNRDDSSFNFFKNLSKKYHITPFAYSLNQKADYTSQKFSFVCPLSGKYNHYNCLAAIATVRQLGLTKTQIKKALVSFCSPLGRLETITMGQKFSVYVDFAHTPNGLKNVLKELKKQVKSNKLIVVFGCAGERDKKKRPAMGKIASNLADLTILTAEDPRTEKVTDIIKEITAGFTGPGKKKIIPDREKAIKFAISQAKRNDIVVICGKGHEKSMCFGKKEYPWSDQKTVKKALQEKLKNKQ